jgi:RNA polymerase sigma factor (sigma-70 family)
LRFESAWYITVSGGLGVALHIGATPLRRAFARERAVAEHLYLCRRAARRFMRRGLDRADLEQIGAIGLIKAVDRYDSQQEAPFEAYAWLLIVGELMHHVRDGERLLRAPRGIADLERRWRAAERALRSSLGDEPSEAEVARFLSATPAQTCEIREYRASGRVVSTDRPNGAEPQRARCAIDELLDRLTVERMLEPLPALQKRIVVAIHLAGLTVVEVAARLGYSRRHVTRLHRGAIERLKRASGVGATHGAEARERVSVSHGR